MAFPEAQEATEAKEPGTAETAKYSTKPDAASSESDESFEKGQSLPAVFDLNSDDEVDPTEPETPAAMAIDEPEPTLNELGVLLAVFKEQAKTWEGRLAGFQSSGAIPEFYGKLDVKIRLHESEVLPQRLRLEITASANQAYTAAHQAYLQQLMSIHRDAFASFRDAAKAAINEKLQPLSAKDNARKQLEIRAFVSSAMALRRETSSKSQIRKAPPKLAPRSRAMTVSHTREVGTHEKRGALLSTPSRPQRNIIAGTRSHLVRRQERLMSQSNQPPVARTKQPQQLFSAQNGPPQNHDMHGKYSVPSGYNRTHEEDWNRQTMPPRPLPFWQQMAPQHTWNNNTEDSFSRQYF